MSDIKLAITFFCMLLLLYFFCFILLNGNTWSDRNWSKPHINAYDGMKIVYYSAVIFSSFDSEYQNDVVVGGVAFVFIITIIRIYSARQQMKRHAKLCIVFRFNYPAAGNVLILLIASAKWPITTQHSYPNKQHLQSIVDTFFQSLKQMVTKMG